jgi:hypothetical protein
MPAQSLSAASPVAIPRQLALTSLAGAATFLILLVLLHFVTPELSPSWRFVSEYAIGENGWIMVLAFLSLSLSAATVGLTVRSQVTSRGGRIGVVLLYIVALSMLVAGIFAMDPITATKDQLTTHGNLHGLASMIGIPGFPIAAVLISRSLARNTAWSESRSAMRWTAHLTWISLVVMYATIGLTLPGAGKFGPDVPIGWPNRILVVAYCVWLIVVARHALQLSERDGTLLMERSEAR